jgi:hypothetical protein
MREIQAEIDVDAPAERIWNILTDFESFPEWNPFIPKARGEAKVGAKLEVRIQPPGSRPTVFRPTVTVAEPGHKLQWLGRLLMPGLFDGRHTFILEAKGEKNTHFIQKEEFSGLLASLLLRSIGANTLRGFQEMNAALKKRAEHSAK